jgi:hypothetical protein
MCKAAEPPRAVVGCIAHPHATFKVRRRRTVQPHHPLEAYTIADTPPQKKGVQTPHGALPLARAKQWQAPYSNITGYLNGLGSSGTLARSSFRRLRHAS